MPIGKRGKVATVAVEELSYEYDGEIVEVDTMTKLPKNVGMLERVTLRELVAACLMRYGKTPPRVFKFTRTMGPVYYAVESEIVQ